MKKLIMCLLAMPLIFMACQEEGITPQSKDLDAQSLKIEAAKLELITYVRQNNISPRIVSGVNQSNLKATEKSEQFKSNLNNTADYNFYQSIIERAINGEDYECGPTSLKYYAGSIRQDWDQYDRDLYYYYGRHIVLDAVYVFDNEDGGQYYGPEGQFTNTVNRTFKDLLRFWDIPTDILLRDAHGNVYDNVEKTASVLQLYGYREERAIYIADLLRIVYGSDKYYNFNHPLLSFNAFAAIANEDFGTPKKIVLGDGLLIALEDLGFGDVAPQGILAHEYAHQVQYAKDVGFEQTPEGTRKIELMADALASYYLTHKKGATMNWKRVQQFLEYFFTIGDCNFESDNHHGTPNQRMKAAIFGYEVATNAQKNGHILTSEEFIALFEAKWPVLIASDK